MKNIGGWLKHAALAVVLSVSMGAKALDTPRAKFVAHEQYQAWKNMRAGSGDCSVKFPAQPEHMQQTMALPEEDMELKYDVFVSGLEDKAVYMMLIAEYPPMVNQSYAELSLETFLNGLITQNPQNRLVSADLVDVQGHKGLDFFITTNNVYFQGRAIMANNKLFLLAMECEVENYNQDQFNFFIDSFSFDQ